MKNATNWKGVKCHECDGEGYREYWHENPATNPFCVCQNCNGTCVEPPHNPRINGSHRYPVGLLRSREVDSILMLKDARDRLLRMKAKGDDSQARRVYRLAKSEAFALQFNWASYTFDESLIATRSKMPNTSYAEKAIAEAFNRIFGVPA